MTNLKTTRFTLEEREHEHVNNLAKFMNNNNMEDPFVSTARCEVCGGYVISDGHDVFAMADECATCKWTNSQFHSFCDSIGMDREEYKTLLSIIECFPKYRPENTDEVKHIISLVYEANENNNHYDILEKYYNYLCL